MSEHDYVSDPSAADMRSLLAENVSLKARLSELEANQGKFDVDFDAEQKERLGWEQRFRACEHELSKARDELAAVRNELAPSLNLNDGYDPARENEKITIAYGAYYQQVRLRRAAENERDEIRKALAEAMKAVDPFEPTYNVGILAESIKQFKLEQSELINRNVTLTKKLGAVEEKLARARAYAVKAYGMAIDSRNGMLSMRRQGKEQASRGLLGRLADAFRKPTLMPLDEGSLDTLPPPTQVFAEFTTVPAVLPPASPKQSPTINVLGENHPRRILRDEFAGPSLEVRVGSGPSGITLPYDHIGRNEDGKHLYALNVSAVKVESTYGSVFRRDQHEVGEAVE